MEKRPEIKIEDMILTDDLLSEIEEIETSHMNTKYCN